MNVTTHIGYAVRKPIVETNIRGKKFARIQIVCKSPYGDNLIPYVVGGKRAESLAKYVDKGSIVGLSGYQRTNSYVNEEGQKIYFSENQCQSITYLGKKNDDDLYVEIPDVDWGSFEGFDPNKL